MDWLIFLIMVLLLAASAFFAASETALTGASRASMLRLSKQGNRDAGVVSNLIGMRERLIGALLLGNNIANIGASALATGIFTAWFGEVGVLYATAVMTITVVIFAEVLPKTIAINAPDRMSLVVARPMRLMMYVLGPLLTVIEAVVRVLVRMFGIKIGANQPLLSPTERLRGAVDLLHSEGKVEKHDRDMLGGLLDLRELQVSDVMVHRTEMVMVNADLPPEELVNEVLASEYTRIPLWRDKPENIIGVLHAKDLLRAIRTTDGEVSRVDVSSIALPPWFVPEMRPVSEQLKAFRRRKTHFALVVDEYGEVEGLVTLEDILEEIVGGI
jgi:Mg2+/Co2+ transporter CorB